MVGVNQARKLDKLLNASKSNRCYIYVHSCLGFVKVIQTSLVVQTTLVESLWFLNFLSHLAAELTANAWFDSRFKKHYLTGLPTRAVCTHFS